jgi:hypothetical protein
MRVIDKGLLVILEQLPIARGSLGVVISALALYTFVTGLTGYLSVLNNPMPMMFVLVFSMAVSVAYDIKDGFNREAIITVVSTCVVFALATWLAPVYRDWYLEMINQLKQVKDADAVIGNEYIRAINNPAVGIGACYAMAIASIRLSFSRLIRFMLRSILLEKENVERCWCCGQPINLP